MLLGEKVMPDEVKLDLIADLEQQLKNPLPTPPVGFPVIWYRKAEVKPGAELAAIVTKVEDAGKVCLTVFPPQGMQDPTRRGSLHVRHEIHQKRHNSTSVNCGSWDYPIGTEAPESHYDYHTNRLKQRIASLKESLPKEPKAEPETTAKKAGSKAVTSKA